MPLNLKATFFFSPLCPTRFYLYLLSTTSSLCVSSWPNTTFLLSFFFANSFFFFTFLSVCSLSHLSFPFSNPISFFNFYFAFLYVCFLYLPFLLPLNLNATLFPLSFSVSNFFFTFLLALPLFLLFFPSLIFFSLWTLLYHSVCLLPSSLSHLLTSTWPFPARLLSLPSQTRTASLTAHYTCILLLSRKQECVGTGWGVRWLTSAQHLTQHQYLLSQQVCVRLRLCGWVWRAGVFVSLLSRWQSELHSSPFHSSVPD